MFCVEMYGIPELTAVNIAFHDCVYGFCVFLIFRQIIVPKSMQFIIFSRAYFIIFLPLSLLTLSLPLLPIDTNNIQFFTAVDTLKNKQCSEYPCICHKNQSNKSGILWSDALYSALFYFAESNRYISFPFHTRHC